MSNTSNHTNILNKLYFVYQVITFNWLYVYKKRQVTLHYLKHEVEKLILL